MEEDTPSFKILTYRERIFKSVFQYLDPIITEGIVDVKTDEKYKDTWKLYERLEDMLYPWIKPHWKHVFDITKSSDGNRFSGGASNQRGLVMCVGNHHFRHAVTSVSAIRDVLGSDIPIEIFYINEYDLDQEYIDYFSRIKNVKTRKIVDMVNNKYTQFGGWAMKPFAMLASSFTEVILMDADVFMFKKPETLFEDEGYIKTGALFFLDRTLFPRWDVGLRWLNSFLPTKSSYVSQSRWFKFTSAHEQESGIVVINKKQALFGLLSTCKMNDKRERDKVSYNRVHGDKEVRSIHLYVH
jgi:hypothetical protein